MNFIPATIKNNVVQINGLNFEIPIKIEDRDIFVGIRPEKMISGATSLKVQMNFIEMTGSERIVYFDLNNSRCSAKLPLDYYYDNDIVLNLDVKDFYFFDKLTGKNLMYC